MNAVTRNFHTPREQVLDRVNHDEAVAELVPWDVLYRGLDVEADALRDRWNTGAIAYGTVAGGTSSLSPVPGLSQRRSSTIAKEANRG